MREGGGFSEAKANRRKYLVESSWRRSPEAHWASASASTTLAAKGLSWNNGK